MLSDHIPSLIIMLSCIVLSAYFSATETAFLSVNKTKLRVLAENGSRRAKLTLDLEEKYDKLITTILIGNNIVNIALSAIATVLFIALIGDMGATVSTIVITIVVLIFGEITPKSLAKDFPDRFAMFSAPFINLLMWLFTPLTYIFSAWKTLVGKILKSEEDEAMSQEELLMFLDEVEQEGGLDEEESELLRNAVEFGDLAAKDILTHRRDLVAVSTEASKEEIAEEFTESRFSRILVYEDSIDKIVGVIHQKDFYHGTGMIEGDVNTIMTPPIFIPDTAKVDDLLRRLQTSKSHIAVVLDEYGGTAGIVTMEDILEQLVGDIWDEHDEVEIPIREIAKDTYDVDGAVLLDDFRDHFETDIESESVSLGGWIMEQMECIPNHGDSFEYENLKITVTKMDEHRIDSVKVVVSEKQEPEEE